MERNHLARIIQKTKQLENEVQMRDAAPQIIRRKNSWNSREPSPAERKKFSTIFEFPPAKVPQI